MPDGKVVRWQEGVGGRRFKLDDCTYKGNDPSRRFVWRGAEPSEKRVWPYANSDEMDAALERGEFHLRDVTKGAARCRVSFLDEREGQVLQTIWTECGRMKGGSDYPTQKPAALLDRIVSATSNPGDIVLDCFVGSGTTVDVAQHLGRRWIGCDINRGAIQISAKRLRDSMAEQDVAQRDLGLPSATPQPAQLAFTTWRVNDYDLQVQHNEAVNLAADFLGLERTKADGYFDGTLGTALVKIVPFGRPLTPLDLGELTENWRRVPTKTARSPWCASAWRLPPRRGLTNGTRCGGEPGR